MLTFSLRRALFAACAVSALWAAGAAQAADADAAAAAAAASSTVDELVVTSTRTTRSAVELNGTEAQKILPGLSPLKAIQTLPGVTYVTADPWGNNEQNTSLFIHGFGGQQLGYTLDGVPLGDQNYGNFNGLSPQRAVISEVVSKVILSSGAGALGTASTSNLGGAVETFTSNPRAERGGQFSQMVGSYDAYRTFLRLDSGTFAGNNSAYFAYARQDAKAWDFNGQQGGDQVNLKFVHDGERGRLTLFSDFSDKIEPNEDATVHSKTELFQPYTRPFLYPDFAAALAYLTPTGGLPAGVGNNYRNYYSDAQRTDWLSYAKYDYRLSEHAVWSNQLYYHTNRGRGVVAGPISAAGLPALFAFYFPGQNLKQVFGGSGYATRTTEYTIDRGGLISTLNWALGDHDLQMGFWHEHNRSSQFRRWYALDANAPTSPYDVPSNPLITQYGSKIDTRVYQFHVQDQWRIRPDLLLQAGFKSSVQEAVGVVPVQPIRGSLVGSVGLPEGRITTREMFLPQVGAVWDATEHEQVFVNVQKNLRHFQAYGAGGVSPFSLGSQAAFDKFKAEVAPETAWTYEAGVRTHHDLQLGPITGVEGQLSAYHVDFKNRLLAVSPTAVITSIVGGAAIVQNVGSVKTDGVDVAATVKFGPNFSFYDAVSYNRSIYQDDYVSGSTTVGGVVIPTVVHISGKKVPGSPEWLNKFVASATYGGFEAQLIGDYVGKRYATYTNDLSVKAFFLLSLQLAYEFQTPKSWPIDGLRAQLNVSNLADEKGDLNVVVGAASGAYNTFPIPPRQAFVTLSTRF